MKTLITLIFTIVIYNIYAQQTESDTTFFDMDSVTTETLVSETEDDDRALYHIRPWIDVPLTAVAYVTNYIGLQRVNDKPRLDSAAVANLDPSKIPSFDKRAIEQDPEFHGTAHTISDVAMKASFAAPFFLLFDDKVREDWWEVILLYLQTEALIGNVYSWGVANFNRVRPFVYHPDAPLEKKVSHGTTNSFYSGHVASTAAATTFMAKVLWDYHPEWDNRGWLFAAAMVPPTFVGIFRYKAGKHFPSDVLAGMPAGIAVGLLVPQLHKWNKKKKNKISIVPFSGEYTGMAFSLMF